MGLWSRIWLGVVLLLGLCGTKLAHAERPEFRMSVAPTELSLGETVTLTVEISVPGLSGPDRYWHPDTADFKVIDSQIKRSNTSTMDPTKGQVLNSVEIYRYVLQPERVGRLRIGPAKIRIGQEEWESNQVSVKVLASGGLGTTSTELGGTDAQTLGAPGYVPPQGTQGEVFLYAVADKTSAWVGEQITVSWLLFTRTEVLKYEPTPPELSGLWSETLFEPSAFFKYTEARLGSTDYVVALVSKRALFAPNAGRLVVPPLQAKIATVTTALGQVESIASKPIDIEIRALPTPQPMGFDPSYVGHFELSATVDRDLLPAGQPLTLSLRVKGEGAMRRTTPPRLSFPGFVFEAPRDHEEKDTTLGDRVAGERLYRYWTTPSSGGEQVIPAIELTYFDVSSGQYQVARTTPIGITVEGDPKDLADAERKVASTQSLDRDVRLSRTVTNLESRVLVDLYRQDWFWMLLLAPPGVYILVVAVDRFRRRLKKETPRARLRRARGAAKARFRIAEIHLKGMRAAKFYSELSHAIYAHMEEWLAESVRSLTRDEMQALLEKRGLDASTVTRVLAELEAFDRARFASSKISTDQMKRDLERTRELLARVEDSKMAMGARAA